MTMSFIEERRAVYAGFGTRELAVAGNGPTILLVHGFGDAADGWRLVLDLLQDAGQAAVAVDLPGFGQADPLDEGELLPQLDAFVAAAIRAYGGTEGVVVVGNSLGGAAAARARSRPRSTRRGADDVGRCRHHLETTGRIRQGFGGVLVDHSRQSPSPRRFIGQS